MKEELIAKIMNYLAQTFKNKLILKGGMLLRLFDSPRSTQDLDYVWIRTKKRNLFAQEIRKKIEKLPNIKCRDIQINSREIFMELWDQANNSQVQLEINVVKNTHLPPETMNNKKWMESFKLKPEIITVMALPEAFAHKIAASLERDLSRDLYDLMQFEPITGFDEETLKQRLSHFSEARKKPIVLSPQEASKRLKQKVAALDEERLKNELGALLPPDELAGLLNRIRIPVGRIITKLESLTFDSQTSAATSKTS